MFTIVGYDKENDVNVVLTKKKRYNEYDAIEAAKKLMPLFKEGKLCNENGTPYEFIMILYNFGGKDQDILWASWDSDLV